MLRAFGTAEERERRERMVRSRGYQEAAVRTGRWLERLEAADVKEAARIREEAKEFFDGLHSGNPDLYAAFQLARKRVYEKAHKIISGEDITID